VKKIDNETFFGGICASIAIIAIIAEMAVNNFSAPAVAAGVKDIATTLVAVLVFIFAVRKLWPELKKETYDSVLNEEFQKLQKKFFPLLNKGLVDPEDKADTKEKLERIHRFNLLTNFNWLFRSDMNDDELSKIGSEVSSSRSTGKFIDFNKITPTYCEFFMNKSTFGKVYGDISDKDFDDRRTTMAAQMTGLVNKVYSDFGDAKCSSLGFNFYFNKTGGLSSPEDALRLVQLTEYVLVLYMIKYQPKSEK